MTSGLKGVKGQSRRALLREHRLAVFEVVFDDYLQGRCPSSYVSYRAKKMLEAGLPKRGRRCAAAMGLTGGRRVTRITPKRAKLR